METKTWKINDRPTGSSAKGTVIFHKHWGRGTIVNYHKKNSVGHYLIRFDADPSETGTTDKDLQRRFGHMKDVYCYGYNLRLIK